jgi:hypothetical protein
VLHHAIIELAVLQIVAGEHVLVELPALLEDAVLLRGRGLDVRHRCSPSCGIASRGWLESCGWQ